ncbi:MAG: hypothetical protein QXW71_00120 [Thermoplasmata archaeon]
MVYSDNELKINVTEKEKKELIINFKIGMLCQLHKEGFFSSEQLNRMIETIKEKEYDKISVI